MIHEPNRVKPLKKKKVRLSNKMIRLIMRCLYFSKFWKVLIFDNACHSSMSLLSGCVVVANVILKKVQTIVEYALDCQQYNAFYVKSSPNLLVDSTS